MSCLTNWPAGHNLSLLIRGALSGCRACFLDFGFSCIPHFSKRGCGFLLGVTTGKEVMFIKCAGSAGRSMLSAKSFATLLVKPEVWTRSRMLDLLFRKNQYLAELPFSLPSSLQEGKQCSFDAFLPVGISPWRRRQNFATCETKTA